jgi:lipopolysaccharide export system permease protein
MIRLLDRYLLRSFFVNYAMSLFVLISLYVVLDLFVNLDEFTESDQGVLAIVMNMVDYYGYNVPLYFAQLSGVITLFAACVTLARMHRQNEVIAVLASGTSMYRLAAPIIVGGLIMNALLALDYELVLPRVAPKIVRSRDDVEGTRVYQIWCVKDGENHLLSAQQFSPSRRMIGGLIVIRLSTDPGTYGQMDSVITADRAIWNPQRRGWDLAGRSVELEMSDLADPSTGIADEQLVPEPVHFYDSMISPEDLLMRKSAQWLDFLSLRQLKVLQERGDADPVRVANVKHGRFAMPINNMILLLLGLSFFMHRLPASVLNQGAKALGTCAVAFIIAFIGQQIVGSGEGISLALPHWLPIFLFGPVVVILLDNVKT